MNRRSDKRKYPRVPLTTSASILVEEASIEITIGNMSMGGILFHTQHQFDLGKTMTIVFCGVYQGKDFKEAVLGKIMTVSRKDSGSSYGFQFSTQLDADLQPFLAGFVNRTKGSDISFLRDPLYRRAERKI
ncbi:MAG: PilZ domain-containing protein [Nitrospirota bacterium]